MHLCTALIITNIGYIVPSFLPPPPLPLPLLYKRYMYRLIIPLFDEWGGGGEGPYGEGGTRMSPPLPRIFDDGLAGVVRAFK